jgi:hypothetical protein
MSGSISVSSSISLRGFNFPSKEGVQIPAGTYGGWSNKNGDLKSFGKYILI